MRCRTRVLLLSCVTGGEESWWPCNFLALLKLLYAPSPFLSGNAACLGRAHPAQKLQILKIPKVFMFLSQNTQIETLLEFLALSQFP